MSESLRDRIKKVEDRKEEVVTVWGEKILVKGMMGSQRATMFDTCTDEEGVMIRNLSVPYLVLCCCFDPETKELLFKKGDEEWFMEKSCESVEKLAFTAMRVSGLTASEVKETEKNSESATTPDTSSSN